MHLLAGTPALKFALTLRKLCPGSDSWENSDVQATAMLEPAAALRQLYAWIDQFGVPDCHSVATVKDRAVWCLAAAGSHPGPGSDQMREILSYKLLWLGQRHLVVIYRSDPPLEAA